MTNKHSHLQRTLDGEWYLVPDDEETEFLICMDRFEAGWSMDELQDWFILFEEKFSTSQISIRFFIPSAGKTHHSLAAILA